ncbi:MAG: polysaccharide pyruvyl transferase family protein [Candidatus Aenigmatarchaeota archaeon]
MKVGIITYHCADNYGATLQAYALQRTISKLGYDPKIINFIPNYGSIGENELSIYRRILRKILYRLPKLMMIYKFPFNNQVVNRAKRRILFEDFRNNFLNLTNRKYKDLKELYKDKHQYDVFIAGSDQVWNYEIAKNNLPAYCLDFVDGRIAKKIAYGVSLGPLEVANKYKFLLAPYLRDFYALSVREEDMVQLVKKISNKPVYHVLDPTLLLSPEEWDEIIINPSDVNYICVYLPSRFREVTDIVNSIIKQIDLPVVNISVGGDKLRNEIKNCWYIGPREFLGYIRNSSFVITNSFHGTVFSFLFRKEFYSILPYENDIRIKSFLRLFSLQERIVNSLNGVESIKVIDYETIYPKLDFYRHLSLKFLQEAIESES